MENTCGSSSTQERIRDCCPRNCSTSNILCNPLTCSWSLGRRPPSRRWWDSVSHGHNYYARERYVVDQAGIALDIIGNRFQLGLIINLVHRLGCAERSGNPGVFLIFPRWRGFSKCLLSHPIWWFSCPTSLGHPCWCPLWSSRWQHHTCARLCRDTFT